MAPGQQNPKPVYVPVYTLHDMREALRDAGQATKTPVILCTGCGHEIPAPNGGAAIQCRDCGKKMQIVSINPAAQTNRAN